MYITYFYERDNKLFQQGDRVGYYGVKFKGTLQGKEGFIHARVEGEADVWCVEFPEMKQNDRDYVLPGAVLGEYRPSKNEVRHEKNEAKVEQRRGIKGKKNAVPLRKTDV